MKSEHDQHLELPPALVGELKRVKTRDVAVPTDLDESVLTEARLTITHRRWRRRTLRLAGAGAALAAAAAIAVAIYNPAFPSKSPGPQLVTLRNDLDGDGRVDILDAFYLARRLRDGSTPTAHDVNGDGKTDQADVDAIARSAVSVGGTS